MLPGSFANRYGTETSAISVFPERGGAMMLTSRTRSFLIASSGSMKCLDVDTSKRPDLAKAPGRITWSEAHS